jgi:hypothetical protein
VEAAAPQLKRTLCTPTLQSPPPGLGLGWWKVTAVAPPHCLFVTTVPDSAQWDVCLQVVPPGMA